MTPVDNIYILLTTFTAFSSFFRSEFYFPYKLFGCVPFGESKNGFWILDLPDFAVERNVKSEIGFVTLVTFRQHVQYARQPLKK